MLIDKTYFQAEISIPNLQEEDFNNKLIDVLIEGKSYSLLESVLNPDLFDLLKDNCEDGYLNEDAPQELKDLVFGKKYEINDRVYRFKGLIHEGDLYRSSLIADYVYCHWLIQTRSQLVDVGEVVINAQNSTNVTSDSKLIKVWNRFFNALNGDYCNRGIHYKHKGVLVSDYYGQGNSNNVSLFKFLADNQEVYGLNPFILPEDAPFYERINHLGL